MSGTSIEELEAALRLEWDLDTLRVYADYLEAAGDPRGELISLDLALAKQESPELIAARAERLEEWLGDEVLAERVRFGMLESYAITHDTRLEVAGYINKLHASPAHPYVRELNVFVGDANKLELALRMLAERPMPWLTTLRVRVVEPGPVPAGVVATFAEAAPNLEELIVHGDRIFHSPIHPNLKRLGLIGGASIIMTSAPMDRITSLALTFDHRSADELAPLAAVINPRAYPRLERLDLSSNEWSYPTALDRNVSVFRFVDAIENPSRLSLLRLPALRDSDDWDAARRLLAQCPGLEIEVARLYQSFDQPSEPRLSLPTPRLWPPGDQMAGRSALTICRPEERYGVDVGLSGAIEALETIYDDLPDSDREAWDQLWTFLKDLDWETDEGEEIQRPLSVGVLARAAQTLADHRWRELVETLAQLELAPTATLMVRRYWGW